MTRSLRIARTFARALKQVQRDAEAGDRAYEESCRRSREQNSHPLDARNCQAIAESNIDTKEHEFLGSLEEQLSGEAFLEHDEIDAE